MKKLLCLRSLLVLLLVLGLIVGGCGSTENATGSDEENNGEEKITLTLSSSWPEHALLVVGMPIYKELVEELSEGKIELKYVGGPEAIPDFEHAEAVRDGTVDMSFTTGGYYFDSCPEATFVTGYSNMSYPEMRETGAHDWLNEVHIKKMNSVVLGNAVQGLKFAVYTRKPVYKVEDFKGLRIRATAVYLPMMTALGAEAVALPAGDIYSSLERGVVDGFCWNSSGMTDYSLHEQISYAIYPHFMTVNNFIIINHDKWSSLPGWAQDVLTEAAIKLEELTPPIFEEFVEKEEEIMKAAGVEFIELEEPEKFLKLIDEANVEYVRKNYPNPEETLKYLWKPLE
ncbi:MAG TPA: TRAP transporter substrate-binding protein DctP [Firmicutes bacterium]|nr:TRAP transporter substrate-binding protein DctP [Bacillota bacterium]